MTSSITQPQVVSYRWSSGTSILYLTLLLDIMCHLSDKCIPL